MGKANTAKKSYFDTKNSIIDFLQFHEY